MVQVTEKRFGVLSDFLGDREDVPNVKMPKAYMPSSSGMFLQWGLLRTMPGANKGAFVDANGDKVQTPDGNIVIHYHRYVSAQGVEYPFAFTKAHIYKWDESNKQFDTFWTCSSDCDLWDTTEIDGKLIATNGVDKVLYWDETDPGTVFSALGSASGLDIGGSYITTAKYCIACEEYLILGATTEGGTYYGRRRRWSTYNDIDDYDETGNGDTGKKDYLIGSDSLKGFGTYTYGETNYLIVFKGKSIYTEYLVESLDVWASNKMSGKIGLLATHAAINDSEGNLYYAASDYTIRKYPKEIISMPKEVTLKGINVTYQDYIEATYLECYNQIWWSVPSSLSSTGNDKIIALNLTYGVWHDFPFAIRAFGDWSQQETYTIDGLDSFSDSIDGLDAQLPSIDYVSAIAGFPLDICSDYSGYTYVLHTSEKEKGASVSREFVISVDLTEKQSLDILKRIFKAMLIFAGRSSEGTIDMFVKRDNEASWQSLSSVSLKSTRQIADSKFLVNKRAKHFLFKGVTTVLCDIIGMYFNFEIDGYR